jgi:hypothetical protein
MDVEDTIILLERPLNIGVEDTMTRLLVDQGNSMDVVASGNAISSGKFIFTWDISRYSPHEIIWSKDYQILNSIFIIVPQAENNAPFPHASIEECVIKVSSPIITFLIK